jgi:hypothetical protein
VTADVLVGGRTGVGTHHHLRGVRNGTQDRTSESCGLSGTAHDNPAAWELGTFESHVADIEPEVHT